MITFFILDKEEIRKKYKSMSSQERQDLILKKMKAQRIKILHPQINQKALDLEIMLENNDRA